MRSTVLTWSACLLLSGASTFAQDSAPRAIGHNPLTGETTLLEPVESTITSVPGSTLSSEGVAAYSGIAAFGPQDAEDADWSPVCKVISIFPDGSTLVSSGTFVDARHVLGLGAAVHQGPGGGWASSVVVAPAWDGDADFANTATSVYLTSWALWSNNGQEEHNQGLICLDQPIGYISGWRGYSAESDDATTLATPFLLGGYPTSCFSGAPDELHGFLGLWDSVAPNAATGDATWTCPIDGMLGAGATIAPTGGALQVQSVVTSGTVVGSSTTSVSASRLTPNKVSFYATTIEDAYSPIEVSLLPLKARVEQDVAQSLDLLDISFEVANDSLVDPGPFTFTYRVVASEDETITEGDQVITNGSMFHDFSAQSTVSIDVSSFLTPLLDPGEYHIGILVFTTSETTATSGWNSDTLTVTTDDPYENLGCSLPGALGSPILTHSGDLTFGSNNAIGLVNAPPGVVASLFFSLVESSIPFKGGTIKAFSLPAPAIVLTTPTNALGQITLPFVFNEEAPFGIDLFFQWVIADPSGPSGFTISNAVRGFTQ